MLKLQRNPNAWSCTLAAYAMALNLELDQLISKIGHDGSQILWPHLPDPMCRRGFHPQEFNLIARDMGYHPCMWERVPTFAPSEGVAPQYINENIRFWGLAISSQLGVIFGTVRDTGVGHAAATYNGSVYDPSLGKMKWSDFKTHVECEFFCELVISNQFAWLHSRMPENLGLHL
jgi:hypothetical protein